MRVINPAAQLARQHEAIRAMQYRQRRWHGPLLDLLWRKPWRSPAKPWHSGLPLAVNARNLAGWLRCAHDCSDPSVACSCQGGFRFPVRWCSDPSECVHGPSPHPWHTSCQKDYDVTPDGR